MSLGRSVALVFLGVVLGIGLTVGTYYGVREYAPDLASRYLAKLLGSGSGTAANDSSRGFALDSTMVKNVVQDILSSEQGKAIIADLVQSQSKELFEAFFQEAMKSPDFRKALSDTLGTFLQSAEGKALLRRIATEVMSP